jgi:NAD(P)-dependent dehydrogenase (short-subunit alcohol dehydrogenase family)
MTTQSPRVAIITGSSRGIGAAIAKRLAANGITVIVNYAGRAAEADQVVTDHSAAHRSLSGWCRDRQWRGGSRPWGALTPHEPRRPLESVA